MRGVCGTFQGTVPALLPVVQSTWAAWRALHPETSVVTFDTGFRRNYNVYPYGDYDEIDNEQLLFPQTVVDRRLPLKDNVVGVTHEGVARAYSMSEMGAVAPRLALNDDVNGRPVLVVFDAEAELAVAFDRALSTGEVVDLDLVDGAFPFHLRDRQTGSLWSLTGEAVEGPLAGERLARTPGSYVAFWFAWASFNPGTELFELSAQG